jgi:hypothetical protein
MDSDGWLTRENLMTYWNTLTADQHTWVTITADIHGHSKEWVINTMDVPSHKDCVNVGPGITRKQKRRRT